MKIRRLKVIMLAAAMLVMSLVPAYGINAKALSARQEYFLEFVISFSRADMYENKICGALTAAQGIIESGWGTSGLGRDARNLFGMRASYTWDGMVYDQYNGRDGVLYSSYDDLLTAVDDIRDTNTWRGYADWSDSVYDHSHLLNTADRYIPLRGEYDYKKACQLILDCGYTGEEEYADALIRCIELYDLELANNISENEFGVAAMAMSKAYTHSKPGDEFDLTYRVLGTSPQYAAKDVKWQSLDENVATVDSKGHVKVIGKNGDSGMIRVSIGNKSTCCLIDVVDLGEYDGFATGNVNMRAGPTVDSDRLGYLDTGAGVKIHGYSDGWYNCTAVLNNGRERTGWVSADYITLTDAMRNIRVIGFAKNFYTVKKGSTSKIRYAFGSCEAENKNIVWTSSDSSVVSVDQNGGITANKYGTAVITAICDGGARASCRVNVSEAIARYSGVTTSALYVRREPNASASYYGIVDSGIECIVTGEEQNGWCQITAVLRNGSTATGWSLAPYVLIKGIYREDRVSDCPFEVALADMTVSDDIVYGVAPQTTVKYLNTLSTGSGITVTLDGQELSDDSFVSTGCVISQTVDDKVVSATVIIYGDVYPDGRINALDYYVVKRNLQGTYYLSDLQKQAADINGSGTTDVSDYILIARHCIGVYDILQKFVF